MKKYQENKIKNQLQKNLYNQFYFRDEYVSSERYKNVFNRNLRGKTVGNIEKQSKNYLIKSIKDTKLKNQRRMIENSKKIAKVTKQTIKLLVKAVKPIGTAIIKALSAIIATIGGTAFIVIIVFIAIFASLMVSPYGALFATASINDDSTKISEVIAELSSNFDDEIERIKDEHNYDDFEIEGEMTNWQDVLAVFSVKACGSDNKPIDIIDINEENTALLKSIFWDMNIIDYEIETVKSGEETERILYIFIENKTCEEMAEIYEFDEKQKGMLKEIAYI